MKSTGKALFNEFSDKLKELNLDKEYLPIRQERTNVKLRHLVCGKEHSYRFYDFFERNHHCFYCELEAKTNGEFIALDFLNNNNSPRYIIQHTKCGKEFQIQRKSLDYGLVSCRYCENGGKRSSKHLSKSDILNKFNSYSNFEYEILDEIINISKNVKMRHKVCNSIFQTSISHFINDVTRCPRCSRENTKRESDSIKDQILRYCNNELEILTKNIKSWDENIIFKHLRCGVKFAKKGKDMLKNCRERNNMYCPFCKCNSVGEKELIKILSKYNIIFDHNKSAGLKLSRQPLRFDFIIYKDLDKKEIMCFLEYDGPQHKDKNKTFGSQENKEEVFLKSVERDNAKNQFSIDKNIPLLRFTDNDFFNLENILLEKNIIKRSSTILSDSEMNQQE